MRETVREGEEFGAREERGGVEGLFERSGARGFRGVGKSSSTTSVDTSIEANSGLGELPLAGATGRFFFNELVLLSGGGTRFSVDPEVMMRCWSCMSTRTHLS